MDKRPVFDIGAFTSGDRRRVLREMAAHETEMQT
jgi:hypothetical protein